MSLTPRGDCLPLLALLGCAACGRAVDGDSVPLARFECRVPTAYFEAAAIPSPVLRLRAKPDLVALESGARYDFVLLEDRQLVVAPLPAKDPRHLFSHPLLARGAAVLTAGGIRVERWGTEIARVTVDQNSKTYCPTAESLRLALRALVALQIAEADLRVENQPPVCYGAMLEPNLDAARRFGGLMLEISRRFEVLGRAIVARNFELARFEVDELEEVFEDDLPRAGRPNVDEGVNLAGLAGAFVETNLSELRSAADARDSARLLHAFESAAAVCNGCHRVAGHGFIAIVSDPRQLSEPSGVLRVRRQSGGPIASTAGQ